MFSRVLKSSITHTAAQTSSLRRTIQRALYPSTQLVANMASHSNQFKKSEKFGHLPLSTSGPQKTTLTVSHGCFEDHPFSLTTVHRETPCSGHHTSTRELPSRQRSARHSSCTVSCPTTSRHSTNKSAAPTNNTNREPAISQRTRS